VSSTTEIWAFRGLTRNLVSRELKVKYKRSVLGWTWSLINPATTIAIYTLVFSVIFRAVPPVAGNGELESFALYLFNALVLWNFFQTSIMSGMVALVAAGDLRRKVYFPVEIPIIATLSANLVQTMIELGILIAILIVLGNVSWTFILIVPILALFLLFTCGIALVVGLANVYYRDVGYLVGVLLNFLLYLTPIIYPLSLVPPDKRVLGIRIIDLLEANPMTSFVQAARSVLYGLEVPPLTEWLELSGISGFAFVVGWAIFRRSAATVVDEL
jgi:ABC-2 type transport system permease protein